MTKQTYFLGANSCDGFYSCYDSFCRPADGDFLWVIKGGPGCGKSSFMRKIGAAAEQAGLNVEYVLCSGDPNSLDGVYLPERKIGYVDGTAPHTIDVPYPGALGAYLDLGHFYDQTALRCKGDEIIKLNAAYKDLYRNAYALLSTCPSHYTPWEIPHRNRKRFHTAISCHGIYCMEPEYPSQLITASELKALFLKVRDTDIFYLHPLWPNIVTGIYRQENNVFYHTEADFPACSSAVSILKEAKHLHDELEALYNPHVDFDGVYNLAAEHIAKYL